MTREEFCFAVGCEFGRMGHGGHDEVAGKLLDMGVIKQGDGLDWAVVICGKFVRASCGDSSRSESGVGDFRKTGKTKLGSRNECGLESGDMKLETFGAKNEARTTNNNGKLGRRKKDRT